MEDFFNKLTIDYDSFTHSQKAIANYLIENQDNVAFDTLEDLSEKIGVSTTTVIRFSRVLGYHGYSDMQKDIQNNVRTKAALPDRFDKTNLQIPKKPVTPTLLLQRHEQHPENTVAAERSGPGTVHPTDLPSGEPLRAGDARLLLHCPLLRLPRGRDQVQRASDLFHWHDLSGGDQLRPGRGTSVWPTSSPGYSKTATTILSWFRNCGVKIILITSQNVTSVMGYGDIILPCTISSVYYKNSYAAPLCLTNFLIAALAQAAPEEARRMLERTENILSQGFFLGL